METPTPLVYQIAQVMAKAVLMHMNESTYMGNGIFSKDNIFF